MKKTCSASAPFPSSFSLSLLAVAVSTLTACGGGGGGTTTITPTQASLSTTVMDGLIQNALVCVDINLNSQCDAGEPQGRTDAQGAVTLNVTGINLSQAKLIASIGTDAVDADTGPVTTAYTLSTPIAKPAVISPLTTMVQADMDATGASLADAEAHVTTQTGLTVSVFDNFVALRNTSSAHRKAAELARLWVVSTQQSIGATASTSADACQLVTTQPSTPAVNENDNQRKESGIRTQLLQDLSTLSALVESNDIQQACSNAFGSDCDSAIRGHAIQLTCPAPTPTPAPAPAPTPTPAPTPAPTPTPAPLLLLLLLLGLLR